MSYLFSLDFSKLKQFYWKNFVGSKDAISLLEHNYYNQKKTYHSNSKVVFKTSNFKNYGATTITIKGKNLKSYSGKYTSYEEFIPKLGSLIITSNKGVSESQAASIITFDSWAQKQNFIIKASKYKTSYGNEKNIYGNKIKYSGNNLFLGSSASEEVFAGNGSDKLYGKNGNDKLYGESGNDKLYGESGNDKLYGESGNDKLYGESGNDLLNGGSGNDKLIGGSGNDTAVFSSKSNVVNLSKTKKQNTKDGLDTLIGIENVNAGSGNDKIYGSKGSNILNGGKGNDLLVGGSGNDKLIGGIGNDKLIGGSGKDIFKLSKGKGYDLIQDFKNSKDKILIGSIKKINLKNKGKDVLIYSGKDLLAKVKKAKGLLSKKGKYLV